MHKFYTMTIRETEKFFETDIKNGLSSTEAKKRLTKYGKNEFSKEKKKGIISKFCSQLNDFLIIVLIIAAAISFIVGIADGKKDVTEPIIILTIVVLNAAIGVFQENRAERSLKLLSKMSAPEASVIRDGEIVRIPAAELVCGDILAVRSGDVVAADGRIVECAELETDESALTGETNSINKCTGCMEEENGVLAERKNMIFSSTFAVSGYARAIVTATGMNTEVGKVASLILNSETPETPIQKRMAVFGRKMGILALMICAAVFFSGILRGYSPLFMLVTSVSLAVAAIPEGLPAVVTIMLAMGVSEMAKRRAVVRHLQSVEALGSAEVICTDKTGTVTENKMRVVKLYSENEELLCKMAAVCCSENSYNPTEKAILNYAEDKAFKISGMMKLKEIPFSSELKKMTVLCEKNNEKYVISKGAAEKILQACTSVSGKKTQIPLSLSYKRRIENKLDEMADEGLRVIAAAYKKTEKREITEDKMIFLGLMGIEDSPRREVRQAVNECRSAGIVPVMITGDYEKTAAAIAKKTGIYEEGKKTVSGKSMDGMSDEELDREIENICVFARVTPEHKVRIVEAWQRKGKVTAMTGDGVNDAPALKKADIGCSLGIAGTEVAKSASDIILTDDNFATIVEAVHYGRLIFKNIRKTVKFLLSSNTGEIITIFIGMLIGAEPPLLAIQLLWVNLVTDSLPAIALGVDNDDEIFMREAPSGTEIINRSDIIEILIEGVLIGALSLFAFYIGKLKFMNITAARTMSFSTLSISQLIHAFNVRSEKSAFKSGALKNKLLIFSAVSGILLQAVIVCLPVLNSVFKTCRLNFREWGIVGGLAVVPLILSEIKKYINSLMKKVTKKRKKS